ncbi:MAG: glycosyltransferase family A protein [Terracidiphilus sp.]|jgi:glycosyltransferase involved in cell wall biosynthesis
MQKLPSYVLVTPARNEERLIEATIKSVVVQSVLPMRWIIVSDGSTDGTDSIVSRYAARYHWIELLRMPERKERHFAGKAYAFAAAQARLEHLPYEVIANLDADITIESGHFAYLLEKLASDPTLGIVGTPCVESSGELPDFRFSRIEHVPGACQVFRRACYEKIGGYCPVKYGSIDCIAGLSARMNGWKTRAFAGMVAMHHRQMGTAQCGPIHAYFNTGAMDYVLGFHPLWEIFRSAYQMTRKPFFIRGLVIGSGYFWALLRHVEQPAPKKLVQFLRQEQMQQLKSKLTASTFSGNWLKARLRAVCIHMYTRRPGPFGTLSKNLHP